MEWFSYGTVTTNVSQNFAWVSLNVRVSSVQVIAIFVNRADGKGSSWLKSARNTNRIYECNIKMELTNVGSEVEWPKWLTIFSNILLWHYLCSLGYLSIMQETLEMHHWTAFVFFSLSQKNSGERHERITTAFVYWQSTSTPVSRLSFCCHSLPTYSTYVNSSITSSGRHAYSVSGVSEENIALTALTGNYRYWSHSFETLQFCCPK